MKLNILFVAGLLLLLCGFAIIALTYGSEAQAAEPHGGGGSWDTQVVPYSISGRPGNSVLVGAVIAVIGLVLMFFGGMKR